MDLTDFINKNVQTVYGKKNTIKENVEIVIDTSDNLINTSSNNTNINSTDIVSKNESIEVGSNSKIPSNNINVNASNNNINTTDKKLKDETISYGDINPDFLSNRDHTINNNMNPTDTIIKDEKRVVGFSDRISTDSIMNPISPINNNINGTDYYIKTETINEVIEKTTTSLINKDKTIPRVLNPTDSILKDESMKTGFSSVVDPITGNVSSISPEDVDVIRYITPTPLNEKNIYDVNLKTGLVRNNPTYLTTVETLPTDQNILMNKVVGENNIINTTNVILKDETSQIDRTNFLEINIPNDNQTMLQQIISGTATTASIGNTLMKEANNTLSSMTGGLFGKNEDYGHPVQNSTEVQNAKANITKGIDYLLSNSKAYLASNYIEGIGNQAKGFTSAGGLAGGLQNVQTGLSIASTIATSLVNALTQYQYWTADEYANIINVNSNDLSVGDGNKEMTIKAFDKGNLVGREFEPEDGVNTTISILTPSKKNNGKWESKLDSKNMNLIGAKNKGNEHNSYEVETSNTDYIKNLRTNNFYSNQDENTGQWSKIEGKNTSLSIENIRDASNTYAYKINTKAEDSVYLSSLIYLAQKVIKPIGFIYVNPVKINSASPFKIPFEFNPILTEGSIEARYSAVSLLSRIGELRSYTGTGALTVSLKTQYLITNGKVNYPSKDAGTFKTPAGFGVAGSNTDEWLGGDFSTENDWANTYTEDYITQLEVAYRSLVLPNFSNSDTHSINYARPPTVKIILSSKEKDDGTFPAGGAYELAYPFLGSTMDSNGKINNYTNNNILASQFNGGEKKFYLHKTFVVSSLTISKTFESQNAYYDESGILRFDGFTVDMSLVETTQAYTDALPDYNIYAQRFGNTFSMDR